MIALQNKLKIDTITEYIKVRYMSKTNLANHTHFDEMIGKATALLEKKSTYPKPTIAVCGLMNAGKSYLLNMLTEHIESEYFKTKDVRETTELKKFENEHFVFLDTPGMDANCDDEYVANLGLNEADIVLFLHQPIGELEKVEVDFLRNLKNSFGVFSEKNIILILSKSDKVNSAEIEEIKSKIIEQCSQMLDFSPKCLQASGARYHKGVQQHKNGLIKASNIDDLKYYIESLVVDVATVREARLIHAIDQAVDNFLLIENEITQDNLLMVSEVNKRFVMFNASISDFRTLIDNRIECYRKI